VTKDALVGDSLKKYYYGSLFDKDFIDDDVLSEEV